MTVSGDDGAIKFGYRCAATLKAWKYEPSADGKPARFTATAIDPDPVSLTMSPLTLTARVGDHHLRFPILEMQLSGSMLIASVGPRERST